MKRVSACRVVTFTEVFVVSGVVAILSTVFLPMARRSLEAGGPQLLNQFRTLAASARAYAEDNDERLPLAFSFDTTANQWRYNRYFQVPAGWRRSTSELQNFEESHAWANSLQPYFGDWDVLETPGLPEVRTGNLADYDDPRFPWTNVSVSMNGLLHTYPLPSIAEPSRLPLFWHGHGRASLAGAEVTTPSLNCSQYPQTPCVYVPELHSGPGGFLVLTSGSAWVYAKTAYFISLDGTLRRQPLGARLSPAQTDPRYDPFTGYDTAGIGGFYWTNTANYPYLFRPDFLFN
jgi:hypothetical protein